MNNNTKILITYPGDRGVGVQDGEVTVNFTYDVIEGSPIVREKLRREMQHAFEPFGQSDPSTRFMDECPDCGTVLSAPIPKPIGHELDCECQDCTNHATDSHPDLGPFWSHRKCPNSNCISNAPDENAPTFEQYLEANREQLRNEFDEVERQSGERLLFLEWVKKRFNSLHS